MKEDVLSFYRISIRFVGIKARKLDILPIPLFLLRSRIHFDIPHTHSIQLQQV
jgi:hypothetical protein